MKHRSTNPLLLLLFILLSPQRSSSLALNVPTHWRLDGQGEPRLCWVVKTTLKGLTRIGFGTTCPGGSGNHIQVSAVSNRAVLQGRLSRLAIQVKYSQSKLIPVEEFLLQGRQLDFGWTPLIVTASPLALLLTRPPLLTMLSAWYLWSIVKRHRNALTSSSAITTSTGSQTTEPKTKKRNHLDFSLTWNNQNLEKSSLLKQACQRLLRFLLSNSVLPMAAAAGDSIQESKNEYKNQNNNRLLTTSGDVINEPRPPTPYPSNQLSALLSATKFELKGNPTFQNNGWLELPGQAILPQGSLPFALRTKPQVPFSIGRANNNQIEFLNPQVNINVRALPLAFPKQILPESLWLTVGAGVAVELGKSIAIDRLGISQDACRMDGRIQWGNVNQQIK